MFDFSDLPFDPDETPQPAAPYTAEEKLIGLVIAAILGLAIFLLILWGIS